jgi:hypothetical protein
MTNSEFNSKSNNSSSNLDVNKQIFIERPIGKINVGKLITLLSFINIGVLFVLFIFSALVCLHAFHKTIGFYGEKGIDQGGIALIVFDSIFLLTALVLQLYI